MENKSQTSFYKLHPLNEELEQETQTSFLINSSLELVSRNSPRRSTLKFCTLEQS